MHLSSIDNPQTKFQTIANADNQERKPTKPSITQANKVKILPTWENDLDGWLQIVARVRADPATAPTEAGPT